MFNFFEQPWTLIGLAVITSFGVLTVRSVWPEKHHLRHWLIPLVIVAIGFGLDFLAKTDLEKINAVITTVLKAAQNEDCATIESLIANDYADSHHATKNHLMVHCRVRLSEPVIAKIKKRASLIELTNATAIATLFIVATFEKDSDIARDYRPFVFLKTRLHLEKQPDNNWLINRIEILEIDKQPVQWNDIN
jgi:predicted DNA binding CopG/RHH family protein